jgi:hypothetical protein
MIHAIRLFLFRHRNTRHVAPEADLFVVESVDGFVFPNGAGAGGGQGYGDWGDGLLDCWGAGPARELSGLFVSRLCAFCVFPWFSSFVT